MNRNYRKVHNRPSLLGIRRKLRNNPTHEENLLWQRLKGKRLHGRKFRRQHSIEMWVVDFYCPSEQLIVELDGSQHFTAQGQMVDSLRDQAFVDDLHLRVLRFENWMVREQMDCVLATIAEHFKTARG